MKRGNGQASPVTISFPFERWLTSWPGTSRITSASSARNIC